MIPGTFRIRIRTRLTALLLAINIVPLVALLDESTKIISLSEHSPQSLAQLQTSIYFQVVLFVGVGVWVVFLVGSNLTRSLEEIIHVLGKIKAGRFANRVRVASNDEIGYTGDVINEMTRGLAERDRIRHSLILAKEVQQNLFPPADTAFKSIHIAGKSIYCDETGGDYYDYFFMGSREERKFGVAVGDVSGHGISSALLMATVRSALRQRVSQPGDTARIITDVNAQLAEDVDISGDFVTLFFLVLDKNANRFEWVRAGHEPAVVYDPEKDAFDKLDGAGIALGLNARWVYESYARSGMAKGQVILLGTDGVWEAQNAAGQRIGKDPIYEVIRSHHTRSARDILDTVFQTIAAFQNGAKNEDDITAVIIKYGHP
jgi:sigma-B regulation protein RsbU (phosphoserine phosphatase)